MTIVCDINRVYMIPHVQFFFFFNLGTVGEIYKIT